MRVQAGDTFTWERTFTEEDVERFADLTGDRGRHHVLKDQRGRLLVHGLLVASVPTKIGGDLDYVARTLRWEFLRPVFTGERISCELTVTEARPDGGRLALAFTSVCRNPEGKDVMTGSSEGFIHIGEEEER